MRSNQRVDTVPLATVPRVATTGSRDGAVNGLDVWRLPATVRLRRNESSDIIVIYSTSSERGNSLVCSVFAQSRLFS